MKVEDYKITRICLKTIISRFYKSVCFISRDISWSQESKRGLNLKKLQKTKLKGTHSHEGTQYKSAKDRKLGKIA